MAVEQIVGHPFQGENGSSGTCVYAFGMGGGHSRCGRPRGQHADVGVTDPPEGHGWLGRGPEGGSNTVCHRTGCGQLRLAKIHSGHMPEFLTIPSNDKKVGALFDSMTTERKSEWGEAKSPFSSEAVLAFTAYSEATLALVRKKDAAYGGAWRDQGYMGNLARVMSKVSRLQNMLWRDDMSNGIGVSVNQESIVDTLQDLMALCAFMGANWEDGNRWGT